MMTHHTIAWSRLFNTYIYTTGIAGFSLHARTMRDIFHLYEVILRYLSHNLSRFDADWDGFLDSQLSTFGYFLYLSDKHSFIFL